MKINSNLIKIILSILLTSLILYYVGPKKIFEVIKEINPWYIPLVLFLTLLAMFIFSLRIYSLAKSISEKISFIQIVKHSTLAFCLGSFSPARAGEIIIIRSLKKEGIPLGSATIIFIIDRLMSIVTIALFSLLGIVSLISFKENILMMILGIVILVIVFLGVTSNFGIRIIRKFLFKSVTNKFEGFSKTLHSFKKDKAIFVFMNLLINMIHLLVRCFVVFSLFVSLKEDIPFLTVVGINAIVTLAAFIPISFSGLGVREGSAVLLFGSLNYSADKIIAVYFIGSFIYYLTNAIALPFFIHTKKR